MDNNFLSKSDYEEPRCPCEKPNAIRPIPIGRVIEKLDLYLDRKDYDSAERHLEYWLREADAERDLRGRLSVLNEQIGLYRKTDRKKECLLAVDLAMGIISDGAYDSMVTKGTTLINAATAYNAFDMPDRAIPLYEEARKIYEGSMGKSDVRLGGLYNNTALTLMKLSRYDEAYELFMKALDIMLNAENGQPHAAVTYCNLADLTAARLGQVDGSDKISEYLSKAEELLLSDGVIRDGEYAFVCEKCAPTFGYYGFFLTEAELKKRAGEIYERA